MAKLRVLLLVHESLVPPDDLYQADDATIEKYRTEYDVKQALLELGHEVHITGVYDDLAPVREAINAWQPDIAFNLLEEFAGNPAFDYYIVSYLEMLGLPYTGCNPRGLLLARDKALSKILLKHHRIRVPEFAVYSRGRRIRPGKHTRFPQIVKSLIHEGSLGISQASHVTSNEQLIERIRLIHGMTHSDAIAEQFISGRELYVTVIGNTRLTVYPIRELVFARAQQGGIQPIATHKVKWDAGYRERWGIDYRFANTLPDGMAELITRQCKRAYRVLGLNGYARFDLRLARDGTLYMLEANPNPGIAEGDDCAYSAEKAGLPYPDLIQKILRLGLQAGKKAP